MTEKSVGRAVLDSIAGRDIEYAFCVPGESYLGTLNAFHGSNAPTLVATRHEEGAGLMAEAYAKASGKTGVCLVTRGPGLTHLSIALHTAQQDSTPMVALVGQVPTDVRYREGFQEVDIVNFGRAIAKDGLEITRADRASELMERAFHIAETGRPGPVLVSMPEDTDRESAEQAAVRTPKLFRAGVSEPGLQAAVELIAKAKRPCIVAGSGVLQANATGDLIAFAEAILAPVYAAWRRFDVFPNNHPLYLGGLPGVPPASLAGLAKADLVIALGTRLGELTTKAYTIPTIGQGLLHIDHRAEDAGGSWVGADVALVADAGEALRALLGALKETPVTIGGERQSELASLRAAYETATTPSAAMGTGKAVEPEGIYHVLRQVVTPDTSISCDAGTFGGWLTRFYRWNEPRTFFGPTAGGMGYALPAAIGAKLARPTSPAIAFAGDGGFAMTMSELETAVRLELRQFVVLVFNNDNYGTIRKHQDKHFPGRVVGTKLGHIDFARTAESMGAAGFTVRDNREFPKVFEAAMAAGRPAVIDLLMDPDRLDPWGEPSA
jgi:acetolactate synthase-1/2/3 large subunit